MGVKTKIEWTGGGGTWNFARGCTKKGKECDNCYAIALAHRFSKPGLPFEGLTRLIGGVPQWTGVARPVPEALTLPLKVRKGTMWFVNSVSDTFHHDLPDQLLDRAFAIMALSEHHEFLLLTKNPVRMQAYLSDRSLKARVSRELNGFAAGLWGGQEGARHAEAVHSAIAGIEAQEGGGFLLPNVTAGASMGTLKSVRAYLPALQATPAARRFISAEPLLEDISHELDLAGIDQVIVGGESGARARPMHPQWARNLRDLCLRHSVAFFFKQWGSFGPDIETGSGESAGTPSLTRIETVELPIDQGGLILSKGGDGKLMVPARPAKSTSEDHGVFLCERFRKQSKQSAGRLLDGEVHDGYPAGMRTAA